MKRKSEYLVRPPERGVGATTCRRVVKVEMTRRGSEEAN